MTVRRESVRTETRRALGGRGQALPTATVPVPLLPQYVEGLNSETARRGIVSPMPSRLSMAWNPPASFTPCPYRIHAFSLSSLVSWL